LQISQLYSAIYGSNNANDILNSQGNSAASTAKAEDSDFANKLNEAKEKLETTAKAATTGSKDKAKDDAALKKECQDFESIFIGMVFKEMRNTIDKSDIFSDTGETSSAMNTYQGMLDDEYSKAMSKRGIGLADVMYKQLSREEKSNVSNDSNTAGTGNAATTK
jgi:flagellar protein FlgJ